MAKAYDFLSTLYYAALKGNLMSFPRLLATVVQIGKFSFNSMLIEYSIGDGYNSDVIRLVHHGKSL